MNWLLCICLYPFATLWPWSGYLGGMLEGVYNIALISMVLHGIVGIVHSRRLLTPWEFIWPLLLIGGAAAFRSSSWAVGVLVVALVVLIHRFRYQPKQIATAFSVSAASAAIAVLYSAYAGFSQRYPTAFHLDSPVVLHFPSTLSGGGLTLALAAAMGIAAAASPIAVYMRVIAGLSAALCLVRLGLLLKETADVWPDFLPALQTDTLSMTVVALALCYAVFPIRIAAKALVAQWMDPPAGKAFYALPPLIIVFGSYVVNTSKLEAAALFALVLCAAYVMPAPSAATGANPDTSDTDDNPRPLLALLCLLLTALIPSSYLRDGNPYPASLDSRNYVELAQQYWDQGMADKAYRVLYRVNELAPHERQSHLWIASYNLSIDHLDHAAIAFSRAIRPGPPPTVLPPVDDVTRSDFKRQLRDAASTLDPGMRSLAYERVLIASGEEENAFTLLQARPSATPPAHLSDDTLARALAWVVGAPELDATFRAWPREQLFGILKDAGAQAMPPSLGPPRGTLEILAPGYKFWEQVTLRFTGQGAGGRHETSAAEPLEKIYMYYAAGDENSP